MTVRLHRICSTPIGPVGIAWEKMRGRFVIREIRLPGTRAAKRIPAGTCTEVARVARRIVALLEGEAVRFPLSLVDFGTLPPFTRAVLRATHRIPRGQTRTYAQVAAAVGSPGAARAAGNALAANTVPLIVPCHRVVKSGGALGGFQGKAANTLKRCLLEIEGALAES